jgi:CheY-like chemotaxis protein
VYFAIYFWIYIIFIYNNTGSYKNRIDKVEMKYILVVDDELDILETIVDTLEIEFDEDNVTIDKAINGVEALKLFNGEVSYDLVVTDLNMPEMDGIELTENIRKLDEETPVIVFTGHGDIEEQDKLTSLGVVSMVKKPYVEDLIEMVKKSIKL